VLKTELAVLDSLDIAAGPVARALLPIRLRGAIHGNWVEAETLAAARAA
jgi:carotenoid cleavage dioxygenase